MTAQFHDPGYNSILVQNDTSKSTVFLFLYPSWLPVCWISLASKSIPPGKKYLYRSDKLFQYEIRIQKENEKRRIILPPTVWTHNKRLLVTEKGDVIEDVLSKYSFEHQMCIRRNNMEDEASLKHGRNLYAILRLDMKEVRSKESLEEQDEMIRKAFRKQMFRFHPDRNPTTPDNHLCQEIALAYSILGDREKRAQYNDLTDYSEGWLSSSKWKAIFKPESHGKYERMKRIGLLLLFGLSVVGGVVLGVMTSGLAAPVVIALSTVSGSLIGGGIQSALRTVSYDSVANGVDMKNFLQSFAVGAAFGAVAGGATAGITSAMVGIGSSALSVAELSVLEMVETGAANGGINGALALLSSDADRAFVDGEDVTLKEVACHAIVGGLAGAAAGAAGGLITKAAHVSASAATVEGEVAEQGFNKWATNKVVKHAPIIGKAAEQAKRKTLTTSLDVIEEELKKEPEPCSPKTTHNFCEKSNYENINFKEMIFKLYEEKRVHFDPEEDKKETIRYVCNKGWYSRMIVEYADAKKKWQRSVLEGSGPTFEIPEQATNILVGFQAWRFKWCDVKKYDVKEKCWSKPTKPHLFMFDNPISYTFTLDGGLFSEHVSKVTTGLYDEVDLVSQ